MTTVPVDTACQRCGKRPKLRLFLDTLTTLRGRLADLPADVPIAVIVCQGCGHAVVLKAAALYLVAVDKTAGNGQIVA
jgi:DNA-directed RNA polymerase subunit RPC12/RpoP